MSTVDIDQAFKDPSSFDVAALDAMLEAGDGSQDPAAATAAPAAPAPASAAAPAPEPTAQPAPAQSQAQPAGVQEGASPAAQASQTTNQPEPQPAGIATRDGKHIIPYGALVSERERAANAERLAQQEAAARQRAEAELAELRSRQAQPAAPAQQPAAQPAATPSLDPQVLAALKEEAPAVAAVLEAQAAEAARSRQLAEQAAQQVAQLQQRMAAQAQRQAEQSAEEVISNNPKLAYLQSAAPQVFNQFVDFDEAVKSQPALANLSLADRVAKTLAMYETAFGPIQLPGAPSAAPAPKIDPAAAAAAAVASASSARPAAPHTLSDLPGGALPPRSEIEAVQDLSTVDLMARFQGMTPEQIDRTLAQASF